MWRAETRVLIPTWTLKKNLTGHKEAGSSRASPVQTAMSARNPSMICKFRQPKTAKSDSLADRAQQEFHFFEP
jgi:hypothetical protein